MLHKDLMHMRCEARRGAVALVCGRPELDNGREYTCESEAVARMRESDGGGSESNGRKKKGEWGQPRPGPPYL
jgi:hypothetical protein